MCVRILFANKISRLISKRISFGGKSCDILEKEELEHFSYVVFLRNLFCETIFGNLNFLVKISIEKIFRGIFKQDLTKQQFLKRLIKCWKKLIRSDDFSLSKTKAFVDRRTSCKFHWNLLSIFFSAYIAVAIVSYYTSL